MTVVTDGEGAFQISSLAPGNYNVKISASEMSDWSASNVPVSVAPGSEPLLAVLQVAPAVTSVTVRPKQEEVAQEQLNQEVKQRVLAVLPNFYVHYEDHPAPLSPRQKLHLGLKVLLDPATIAAVGITAGIQQKRNSYNQYGQGSEGFAKRFGAEYATAADAVLITSVLANSVLHQDPRYFYSGKGTTAQRTWYAVKSAFRARGDNGQWQLPYSVRRMTIALILAIAVGVGAGIRRWWALLLPLFFGCVSAAVVSMRGRGLADTPIPFRVVVGTLAMAIGILLRTRRLRHSL